MTLRLKGQNGSDKGRFITTMTHVKIIFIVLLGKQRDDVGKLLGPVLFLEVLQDSQLSFRSSGKPQLFDKATQASAAYFEVKVPVLISITFHLRQMLLKY